MSAEHKPVLAQYISRELKLKSERALSIARLALQATAEFSLTS
jgi:hypothetical protein